MFCSFDATFRMQEIHQHIIEWSRTALHDDNLSKPLQATDHFKTLVLQCQLQPRTIAMMSSMGLTQNVDSKPACIPSSSPVSVSLMASQTPFDYIWHKAQVSSLYTSTQFSVCCTQNRDDRVLALPCVVFGILELLLIVWC